MGRQDTILYTGMFQGVLAGGIVGSILNSSVVIGLGLLVSFVFFVILGVKSVSRTDTLFRDIPAGITSPLQISPNYSNITIISKALVRFKKKNKLS
jgi:hypothetical protein